LTPPTRLGFVDSYFQGATKEPVILIQDLHANYGVQKKIMGLLQFLEPRTASNGRSMTVGVEGAWGDIDLSFLKSYDLKVRQAVGDVLLKNAESSGMEQFSILSPQPVR